MVYYQGFPTSDRGCDLCPFDRCSSLVSLSLNHNKLRHLPDEIAALTSLQELNVAYNELESLPLDVGPLVELRSLRVHQNRLSELPEVRKHRDR